MAQGIDRTGEIAASCEAGRRNQLGYRARVRSFVGRFEFARLRRLYVYKGCESEKGGEVNWRIYRLPGSRKVWHIDAGPGTPVFNVFGFECFADAQSVDIGDGVPRAWIEIPEHTELHIVDGKAIFTYPGVNDEVRRTLDTVTGKEETK
jgi:hypothetical protein